MKLEVGKTYIAGAGHKAKILRKIPFFNSIVFEVEHEKYYDLYSPNARLIHTDSGCLIHLLSNENIEKFRLVEEVVVLKTLWDI